jgi:hypothetical protein
VAGIGPLAESTDRSSSGSVTAMTATTASVPPMKRWSPTSPGARLQSYRQMPVNLYQIQTKFRDEIRPRFGLMRCREFVMKDAYSFDVDDAAASRSYEIMRDAYTRIFARCGLDFRAVEADSGTIGGSYLP